jgi:hypothetical protein
MSAMATFGMMMDIDKTANVEIGCHYYIIFLGDSFSFCMVSSTRSLTLYLIFIS